MIFLTLTNSLAAL